MPVVKADNRMVSMEYVDEAGEVTKRPINLATFYRRADHPFWYIDAFCQLRSDQRTFRTDRILSVLDPRVNPNMALDCSSWLGLVLRQLDRTEADAGLGLTDSGIQLEPTASVNEADSILKQHFHALRALLYIAKADKAFRAAEKRLYQMFLSRVAAHRMDTADLRERCMKLAMGIDPPTTGQFNYSVRQIQSRTRAYRMAVCATAKAMLNSDKSVVSYEQKLFNHLVTRLRPLEEH